MRCQWVTAGQAGSPKTYAYDDLSNPTNITTNFVGGPQGQMISYIYYPDGSRKQMILPTAVGVNDDYFYTYDGVGRPIRVSYPWSGTAYANHRYYPNGWLNTTTGSFFKTTHAYNARGLLQSLKNETGATLLSQYTAMTYDAAGNRFGVTSNIPAVGQAPAASRTQTFSYDVTMGAPLSSRDVLLSEVSGGGNAYGQTYTNNFQYDAAYNPTQIRSGALIPYNSNNQRTGTGFAHDGDGNATSHAGGTFAAGTTFSYDVEDNLTQIVSTNSAQNLTASYGADGLRAKRTTPIQGTLYFLYDETGFSQAPLLEMNASGAVIALNAFAADGWRARYYPFQSNSYQAWFYSFDPQGNVVQRKPEGYNTWPVYDTVLYDSYGMVSKDAWTFANQGSPHKDPVGFGGQYGYHTE